MSSARKTLYAQALFFRLPDWFGGSVADAFRIFADYLDAVKHPTQATHLPLEGDSEVTQEAWRHYCDEVLKDENPAERVVGSFGVHETEKQT